MNRVSLVMAALAAGGVLAGCGAEDFNPDVVAQAADKTAAAGGAKIRLVEETGGTTLHGTGFVDSKGRRARISLDIPGAGTVNSVYVGGVLYMHLPPSAHKRIPGGKAWMKIDLVRFGKRTGIDLGALQSLMSSDPTALLEQLRGASDVKPLGSEQVRGADTTHYRGTIDLRKAVEKARAAQRDAARRSVDKLIVFTKEPTLPVDVWVDDAGRARRLSFTQTVARQMVTQTIEFYDFGSREAIKTPPASETADITDLAAKEDRG